MSRGVRKKFKMTNLTMPNNNYSMKFVPKSVAGLADVGVLHGVGDGPWSSTQMSQGSGKNFK